MCPCIGFFDLREEVPLGEVGKYNILTKRKLKKHYYSNPVTSFYHRQYVRNYIIKVLDLRHEFLKNANNLCKIGKKLKDFSLGLWCWAFLCAIFSY
jgi:hypothetical protein